MCPSNIGKGFAFAYKLKSGYSYGLALFISFIGIEILLLKLYKETILLRCDMNMTWGHISCA